MDRSNTESATATRRVLPVPTSTDPRDLGFVQSSPVKFESPTMIVRTLATTVGMLLFGERDRQDPAPRLPAYEHPELSYADRPELWIDFVADTGDGFDATYTVARAVSTSRLRVGGHDTRRGHLLVLGGDLAYPFPDRRAYRNRLVGPYRAASPVEDDVLAPDAVALAGKHDWFDGLSAFRTTFTQGGWFGSWRLRQTRSYIAIALPHRYWLWGIDAWLGVDVEPQRTYFKDAAAKLLSGDRVILCTHHPLWRQVGPHDLEQLQLLSTLIEARGAELSLQLSGKYHYYARYRAEPSSDAIICGGGGAFLDDSSTAPRQLVVPLRPSVTMERRECFPSPAINHALVVKGLARLLVTAWPLAVLGGLLWSFGLYISKLSTIQPGPFRSGWLAALCAMWGPGLILVTLVAGALVLMLARQDRSMSDPVVWLMGTLHLLAHVTAGSLATICIALWLCPGPGRAVVLFGALSVTTVIVLVMYLYVARLAGAHGGEILPTLRIPDWKSFVRFHIGPDGTLRLFPIGIPEVPRHWRLRTTSSGEDGWFEIADDGVQAATTDDLVQLIHDPIVMSPNDAQRAAIAEPPVIMRSPPYDIFISYARADADWVANFLDALVGAAPAAGVADLRVFVDTESLVRGEYWRIRIAEELHRCHAFVAVWTPAYVTAWHARRTCFFESEQARRRAEGDDKLIFDILASLAQIPDAVGLQQFAHLEGVAPEALSSSGPFETLCRALLERVHERRGGSPDGDDRRR